MRIYPDNTMSAITEINISIFIKLQYKMHSNSSLLFIDECLKHIIISTNISTTINSKYNSSIIRYPHHFSIRI